MSIPSPRRNKRKADTAKQVFQRLVEAILTGELESGIALREASLARQWNVSRTPLREAVRRAAEGGLLVLRPNQPPLIRSLDADDARALYDLREVLEVHALKLAWPALTRQQDAPLYDMARRVDLNQRGWQQRCLKFDLALHHWWTDHCGNPWLRSDLHRHYQFLRIFQRWIARDPHALVKSYEEHLVILQAVREGHRAAACHSLRTHIRESARSVRDAMRTQEGE